MYYIWCEDESSGFYFWYLINKFILDNKYIVVTKKSISKLTHDLELLEILDDDKYFICVDNCLDNQSVANCINTIDRIVAEYPNNIRKIRYIAFEQAIVLSNSFEKYFNIGDNRQKILSILREHCNYDYADVKYLIKLLRLNGIQFSTTEKIYNKLIENVCTKEKCKIHVGNKTLEKRIMWHHYITKDSWSECWKTDCVSGCPERFCWKSSMRINEQLVDCKDCENTRLQKRLDCFKHQDKLRNKRKFEDYVPCDKDNKCIPNTLEERVKDLFENSILKDDIEFLKNW